MPGCVAHVGAEGRLMTVTVDGRRWSVLIRRIDGACDARLVPFHGREISARRLQSLLPSWPDFVWTHRIASAPGLPCESQAWESPYLVTLIYPPNATLRPEEVVAQFARDLGWAAPSYGGVAADDARPVA